MCTRLVEAYWCPTNGYMSARVCDMFIISVLAKAPGSTGFLCVCFWSSSTPADAPFDHRKPKTKASEQTNKQNYKACRDG